MRSLAFQFAIFAALGGIRGMAAPPNPPSPREVIATPSPQRTLPAGPVRPGTDTFPVPDFANRPSEHSQSQPPPLEDAQPAATDRVLPINLATALYLSNARPLVIAFAQARVEEGAAVLQNAKALWLPNLNVGMDYYRHDGLDQSTDGTMLFDDKSAFAAGGGATLDFAVTDAIFRPLAARQELAARESDLQTARNDALLAVALAYFDVQQSRGQLAGAMDVAGQTELLVQKIGGTGDRARRPRSRLTVPGLSLRTSSNRWPPRGPAGASAVRGSRGCCGCIPSAVVVPDRTAAPPGDARVAGHRRSMNCFPSAWRTGPNWRRSGRWCRPAWSGCGRNGSVR